VFSFEETNIYFYPSYGDFDVDDIFNIKKKYLVIIEVNISGE